MALRSAISTIFFLLTSTVVALQVTPDSPCAAICLDSGSKDVSDPIASNTFSTDVVCRDNDYIDLEEGRKYKTCMRCLQGSSAYKASESDQGWFIYNLRFTVSSCLFDWSNSTTDVCSTQSTCGPLQKALQEGSLDPSKPTWPYCSADENIFLGSNLETCIGCLRTTKSAKYLANFLVALQAGCIQRPSSQVLVGIDGDLFTTTPAKMGSHGNEPVSSTNSEPRKGLSQGAIIGIAVGVGVPVLFGIALLIFFCVRNGWHKRGSRAKMSRLASPLDSRFGSTSITSPTSGAYGNPYASPRIEVKETMTSAFTTPRGSVDFKQPGFVPRSILKTPGQSKIKLDTKTHTRNAPSYPPTTVPTHQAYIPTDPTPVSPISATSTIAPLPFSSNYTSPKPSPMYSPQTQQTMSHSSSSPRFYVPALHSSQARRHLQEESLRIYAPTSPQETPQSSPTPAFHMQSRSRSMSQSRTGSRARSRSRSGSRPRSKAPSRSSSIATTRDRSTVLAGVGNSNASQEQPISSRLSGAMLHFDFDLAEKDRLAKEGVNGKSQGVEMGRGRDEEESPAVSEGGEQWPGNY